MNEGKGNFRDEIFSKSVRAGKRTYFFDVKSTRGGDLYLTITESKKRFQEDGTFYFEKHKLFLYKEDFEKFSDGLSEVIDKIEELKGSASYQQEPSNDTQTPSSENTEEVAESTNEEVADDAEENNEADGSEFKEVDFDDLGK